jgi:WD40 repeat protein
MVFSPDSMTMAAYDHDGVVEIWDLGATPNRTRLPAREVERVALSPDGDTVATADQLGNIRFWSRRRRAAAGPELHDRRGFYYPPDLLFSPDGRMLASTVGGMNLWDVRTGRRIGDPLPLASPDTQPLFAFAADGSRFVSVGSFGVRSWDPILWTSALAPFVDRICGIVNRDLTDDEIARFQIGWQPGRCSR